MKNLLLLPLLGIIFFSCEKLDEPDLLGTYTYIPEGCDPGANPELGCASTLTLSPDGVADILPSGDIMYRTTFKVRGEKIIVAKADEVIDQYVFRYVDNSTLKNERDGALWVK
ncbi:hypothetical protein SAMN04489724_2048 [Algoriphagus locisalis]|uniref:Uncharacterized protein n=1 Tax=Algoriphagus locisalis TaxID=305507 RepID=A0A1I7AL16_9BACT|nr:hypothetical protein [Algoriphagus locisalis]SFT75651.1 hypothetical protein SAMN04489724_2048 [Algoriphagus locisalis]